MTNYEVASSLLPPDRPGEVEAWLEAAFAAHGLTCTLKGTLGKYPGCVHWHWKQGKQSGTLEATWWPREGRCWLTVQSGRASIWTDGMAQTLVRYLEAPATEAAPKSEVEA